MNMMNRILTTTILILCLAAAAAWAQDEGPGFKVARLVLATDIVNREPVGITTAFPEGAEQAYCFLEAQDIQKNTQVAFVWYYKDTETARIELPVRKGSRWRTYSSKKFGVRRGPWRVDIEDADGNVLQSLTFEVR
jgi:hypothetical protein